MLKIDELRAIFNEIAPYQISYNTIENGGYDNSGVLVKSSDSVNKILFSLDLSFESIKKAKNLKVDTIVTHHPAIYSPLKNLDIESPLSGAVALAVQNKLNVISNHLNLDMTEGGIDECLALGLSGEKGKILDPLFGEYGYGREFGLGGETMGSFVSKIKKNFNTKRVVVYGSKSLKLSKGASFCGGGADHALESVRKNVTNADVIITSDCPHHVIKELIEYGKAVVLLTHYASENFGFKKFYEKIKEILKDKAECFYFEDARFM